MPEPKTYRGLIREYRSCSQNIRDFFGCFEDLVTDYIYEVSIAYCFLKLEQAYNRTLYGGLRKVHLVHADVAGNVLNKQHITRDGFLTLFNNIFGEKLSRENSERIKFAEKIRDRIIHGKSVSEKDSRKCLSDILDFSCRLEEELQRSANFSPFGDMRGLTGRYSPLDKSTSKWVMRGMGFHVPQQK